MNRIKLIIKKIIIFFVPAMLAVAVIFSIVPNKDVYGLTIESSLGEIGDEDQDGEDFIIDTTTSDSEESTETTSVSEESSETETTTACKHSSTKLINVKKATTSSAGYTGDTYCNNCKKTISKGSTIAKIKSVTLSKTIYTYNGSAKKPTVTVKDSSGKKISSSNYTVTYSNNKKVGKASVTVKFKENYSGTVKKTFKINPKTTGISNLTAKSKEFKVTWKKVTTQTTGYQVQYSTSKTFKNAVTKKVGKNSTKTLTVKSLKAKKKYYVRVRTYKKVNGKVYYSSWSKAKSVKTKK